MDGYNSYPYNDDIQDVKLPKWVWLVAILGLIIAVLSGYVIGNNAAVMFNEIIAAATVEDTNGESTSLNTLAFEDFIGIYDKYYGFNKFDADLFTISYDSSALYDNSLGTYTNVFSSQKSANLSVSFRNLNYYDVSYVYEGQGSKLSYSIEFKLQKGNMEAAIVRVDKNYRVYTDEYDNSKIEAQYVQVIDTVSIEKNNLTSSVPMDAEGIYMIVFAGESASGSYELDVDIT